MNNSFGLEDETVHSNASSFGSKSQFYQYNIDDNILSDKNFHSPLFFVNGSVDTTTSPLLNNPIG
ncbi:MAG: hypothetical protein LBB45_06975 [Methanobrevibacter sp.]|nr:hypothetical protein [Candidatus Methanovirga basalitermitum]